MNKPYVFISYSTIDQMHADKIYDFLTANGINAWISTKNIHGGESFAEEITKAIEECSAFIFVLSQNSDKSRHCGNELCKAFNEGKPLFPYRLHEFELSKSNTYFLEQAQWINGFINESSALYELLDKVSIALNKNANEVKRTSITIKTAEDKQIENFTKRAYQALNEKDFSTANDFAEKILNINMEFAEAYLIKALCDLNIKNVDLLKKSNANLNGQKNFEYAKQYANEEFLEELLKIERELTQYKSYKFIKEQISKPFNYGLIKDLLETEPLKGYKDCDKISKNLLKIHDERIIENTFSSVSSPYLNLYIVTSKGATLEQIEDAEKEARQENKNEIKNLSLTVKGNIDKLKDETLKKEVSENYEKLLHITYLFQDAKYDECIEEARKHSSALSFFGDNCANDFIRFSESEKSRINERKQRFQKEKEDKIKQYEIEKQKKKKKTIKSIFAILLIVAIISSVIAIVLSIKENKYQQSKAYLAQHRYEEAMDILHNLDYKDSSELYFYADDMVKGKYYNIVEKYNLTEFEIPTGVTEIKNSAFYGCSTLTSVIIPDSVTKIGKDAFYKCTALKSISIPDNVTDIGECAFDQCSSLESITFGSNSKLKNIERYAFTSCESLKSVKIPTGVKIIPLNAFSRCTSLTEVVLHKNVKEISDFAFIGCSSLTKIVIPLSVEIIGERAFDECSKLTIYCEATSKPNGWEWNWNYAKRPEIWGYKGD